MEKDNFIYLITLYSLKNCRYVVTVKNKNKKIFNFFKQYINIKANKKLSKEDPKPHNNISLKPDINKMSNKG